MDPVEAAKAVGLRYIRETTKGYTRRRAGKGFCYLDEAGRPIRDKEILRRIRSLVIPPAWERVWICAQPCGHLQAVGYDARGRKQYRYHPDYSATRNETKFGRMTEFAKALPAIRQRVRHDLAKPGLPREKVLATVVRLLETTCIRIGNVEYARENHSFGLTTLRHRHAAIEGSTIRFHFRGKSGLEHEVEVHDARLARIVRECQDLPGYELFQYVGDSGERHTVDSCHVNEYLREVSEGEFTAKDFRTWAGTVQAALELAEVGPGESATAIKRNVVAAVKGVASRLGNRPATSRKYYVHPAVLTAYEDGALFEYMKERPATRGLHPEEECVVRLLEACAGVQHNRAA
jgi:DNA topoisomerase-1